MLESLCPNHKTIFCKRLLRILLGEAKSLDAYTILDGMIIHCDIQL